MTKDEYLKIYNKEPEEIYLTDEDIKDWLDRIVDSLIAAKANAYDLLWGKLNDGEYENNIQICNSPYNWNRIHIYQGIEMLAKAVGYELKCDLENGIEYPYRYYFEYRGIMIFSLEKEPL